MKQVSDTEYEVRSWVAGLEGDESTLAMPLGIASFKVDSEPLDLERFRTKVFRKAIYQPISWRVDGTPILPCFHLFTLQEKRVYLGGTCLFKAPYDVEGEHPHALTPGFPLAWNLARRAEIKDVSGFLQFALSCTDMTTPCGTHMDYHWTNDFLPTYYLGHVETEGALDALGPYANVARCGLAHPPAHPSLRKLIFDVTCVVHVPVHDIVLNAYSDPPDALRDQTARFGRPIVWRALEAKWLAIVVLRGELIVHQLGQYVISVSAGTLYVAPSTLAFTVTGDALYICYHLA